MMKKYIKDITIFVFGLITAGSIGVAAYTYNANNIEYTPKDSSWKVSTVAEAINSLVNDTKGSVMNYSTDEQVVGTWIDGKPLYQKTISNLSKNTTMNAWNDIANVSTLDIDKIIYSEAVWYGSADDGVMQVSAVRNKTSNMLKVLAPNLNVTITDVTIRYTKTTDTGSSNNS